MQENLLKFKNITRENFRNPNFTYHTWMVEYHLDIVEKIAMELCDIYPNADKNIVQALVWFHDFGKPINEDNERPTTLEEGPKVMKECSFDKEFIEKVVEYWKLMEQKNEIDLRETPIEVQIVSSADGASHFTGVFYPSYFNEDGDDFETTQKHLIGKITKDWERKMVLPEIKKAFQQRYLQAREMLGEFPEKFL